MHALHGIRAMMNAHRAHSPTSSAATTASSDLGHTTTVAIVSSRSAQRDAGSQIRVAPL